MRESSFATTLPIVFGALILALLTTLVGAVMLTATSAALAALAPLDQVTGLQYIIEIPGLEAVFSITDIKAPGFEIIDKVANVEQRFWFSAEYIGKGFGDCFPNALLLSTTCKYYSTRSLSDERYIPNVAWFNTGNWVRKGRSNSDRKN